MIQAELANGCIVELVKDCSCLTHDGPHWLHSNDQWRRLNLNDCGPEVVRRAILRGSKTWELTEQRFYERELERLAEKRQYMERLGIVRLIRTDTCTADTATN